MSGYSRDSAFHSEEDTLVSEGTEYSYHLDQSSASGRVLERTSTRQRETTNLSIGNRTARDDQGEIHCSERCQCDEQIEFYNPESFRQLTKDYYAAAGKNVPIARFERFEGQSMTSPSTIEHEYFHRERAVDVLSAPLPPVPAKRPSLAKSRMRTSTLNLDNVGLTRLSQERL